MSKMKRTSLLIIIWIIGLASCQSDSPKVNDHEDFGERIFEQIKTLPDTVLASKNVRKNEFMADLSHLDINADLSASLHGRWITESGKLNFWNTRLVIGRVVEFYDTTRATMTGWGTIRYNRAAKFYFTEGSSHMYEFYVLGDRDLILTQYDYRNDDLTIKDKPASKEQELTLEFVDENHIRLSLNGQTAELKKEHTTTNKGYTQ